MSKPEPLNPPPMSGPLLRGLLALCLMLVLSLSLPIQAAWAAGDTVKEYGLKAAFLYNFGQFVEWPEQGADKSFHICVLGEDPFGDSLRALEQRRRAEQAIVIDYPRTSNQAKACQILYLGPDQRGSLAQLLAQLRGEPVLTVSSLPEFIDQGGMIGFVLDEGKVRLEINLASVRQAKLKPSAKLMGVARRVIEAGVKGARP